MDAKREVLFTEMVTFEPDPETFVVVDVTVIATEREPGVWGEPRLWAVRPWGSPTDDLATLTWTRLLDTAVAQRLAVERVKDKIPQVMYEDGFGDFTTPADFEAVRRYRRNNRVDSGLLERAAEHYVAGGAQQVADELHVSRRQADRYVKRARETGMLT